MLYIPFVQLIISPVNINRLNFIKHDEKSIFSQKNLRLKRDEVTLNPNVGYTLVHFPLSLYTNLKYFPQKHQILHQSPHIGRHKCKCNKYEKSITQGK